jgi:hypothetical protein
MTNSQASPSSIRFRPISKQDLSRYARHLAWLIEEPYQKTQGLLARIYGYANFHELQVELAKAGLPGPFDEDQPNEMIPDGNNSKTLSNIAQRRRLRILEIISDYKGVDIANLSSRYQNAADIGLFKSPVYHRKDFRLVRDREDVLWEGTIRIPGIYPS